MGLDEIKEVGVDRGEAQALSPRAALGSQRRDWEGVASKAGGIC